MGYSEIIGLNRRMLNEFVQSCGSDLAGVEPCLVTDQQPFHRTTVDGVDPAKTVINTLSAGYLTFTQPIYVGQVLIFYSLDLNGEDFSEQGQNM